MGDEKDDTVGDNDRTISSEDEEVESIGEKEEESVVDYVKEMFLQSKVDELKFLINYQIKHKAALKGTVLEVPIKVDAWNEKYLLREMKEIYNKVVPNVIIHNKKLRITQNLYEIPNIVNASKKLSFNIQYYH